MFITKKVFDPELAGKAVFIKGRDSKGVSWNGFNLVKRVEDNQLIVVDNNFADFGLQVKDFDENLLTLTIWDVEEPQPTNANGADYEIHRRSLEDIRRDNRLIVQILKTANRPMKLREIVSIANEHGRNWRAGSGTNYVQYAMAAYPHIKNIKRGVYQYCK